MAAAGLTTWELGWVTEHRIKDGLAPGAEGWEDDGRAFIKPWRFSLTSITVPTIVMHGRQDQFVPFGHGEWLAAQIPGVEGRPLDHGGHACSTTAGT